MNAHSSVHVILTSVSLLVTSSSTLPLQSTQDDSNQIYPLDQMEYLESRQYGQPSHESGNRVTEWYRHLNTNLTFQYMNPEQLGEYAEGDILHPNTLMRFSVKLESKKWQNGIVPYVVGGKFEMEHRRIILNVLQDFHKYTCIKFKPYTGKEKDYINITKEDSGCWSSVGRIGGRQDVNLQMPGCAMRRGSVIHELMHAIGFLHEQNRPDRDLYVNVQWQNIKPGSEGQFKKINYTLVQKYGLVDTYGYAYDYGSVMHYDAYAFSSNGQPTIVPKYSPFTIIGQRKGFSSSDIQKIRKTYNCSNQEGNKNIVFPQNK